VAPTRRPSIAFPDSAVQLIETVAEMRELVDAWRRAGEQVALVPTMGNLHAGHLSLVHLAAEHAEHVIVSVFVNPTQFGPDEDFAEYPRTFDMDQQRLSRAGVHALFAPTVDEMYPEGVHASVQVMVPDLSDVLEGEWRPGHFSGVASVVCRLFNICTPHVAVFGQKDYQQLVVLRRMAADLHTRVKIIAGATARADSGLALSSRNNYLSAEQKAQAAALYVSLSAAGDAIRDGQTDYAELEAEGLRQLEAAGLEPEYFSVRRAFDLSAPGARHTNLVVLAAARLGKVRLLDNILVTRNA